MKRADTWVASTSMKNSEIASLIKLIESKSVSHTSVVDASLLNPIFCFKLTMNSAFKTYGILRDM